MEVKDIEKLAELAKIELTEAEKEALLKDMDGVLSYVKQVEEVEVSDVEEKYLVKNVWREDEEKKREFSQEIITEQYPDSKDGFLKVKKIL